MARKDAGLVEALQRLGAKRVEAALVALLVQRDGLDTRQIVAGTGLRQPEVSVGMRSLRERGWVKAEPIPRKRKGRPMNRYHLVIDPPGVRSYYEELARDTIQATERALQTVQAALR